MQYKIFPMGHKTANKSYVVFGIRDYWFRLDLNLEQSVERATMVFQTNRPELWDCRKDPEE